MSEKPPRELIEPPPVPPDAPAKRKARLGRSLGLTPRITEIIASTIAAGNYFTVAASAAGISESTLKKWRAKGRRGVEPYASLEKAIEQADRDCETALVAKIMAATNDDWRAAALMLERKYPERWSRYRERALLESEGGLAAFGFSIVIHVGETEDAKWAEQAEQRRRQLQPALDVTPPKNPDPDSNLN